MFEYGGGQTVIDIATSHNDDRLLTRIRGQDLFACEAQYHPNCRKKYTSNPALWNSIDPENIKQKAGLEEANQNALQKVVDYVSNTIIVEQNVVMLSHLRRLYATELQQTRYDNPHYRAEKLEEKLQKHPELGSKLEFTLVETGRGKLPFYLVFNSSTKTSSAIAKAYQLASQDPMRDVAMILRGAILQAYEQADDAHEKWPPQTQWN
ncbi:uncharacterized protein LOC143241060 [Tachypleus tridentatus]|uniref:uncharacterized protein LOC143241060 n=1 Tax=Tachypleus tridentatus TaxID=6853 RepID=UPI003FD5706F